VRPSNGCFCKGFWVCKLFVRLGLRGHHPHPPAPSPASGRGGAARALTRVSGEFWGQRVRWRIARFCLCFAPLAPGRGEGLGVRGKSAQWLLLRLGFCDWDWGGVSCFCAWVCAVTTLTPRLPLPPAGEGEQRTRARLGDLPVSQRAREYYSVGGSFTRTVFMRGDCD
jgi:hypothetical protein